MVSWICRGGVAPGAAPKADATGMAPEKSAGSPLVLPEGFLLGEAPQGRRGGQPPHLTACDFCRQQSRPTTVGWFGWISLVNPPSGGLGLTNAKIGGLDRRTLW